MRRARPDRRVRHRHRRPLPPTTACTPNPPSPASAAPPDFSTTTYSIAATIPGGYEGAEGDPTAGIDAIRQWTSVVHHPNELTWLRESLTLNAAADQESDE
ncbi:MAG TPA: hypothetical protein VIW24_14945 [Aldersonia sp.]